MSALIDTARLLWQPDDSQNAKSAKADRMIDTREFLQSMLTLSQLLEKHKSRKEKVFDTIE